MRGLWVEALGEDPALDSVQGIDRLIGYAVDNRITDLYLQVFRGGRCWFEYPGSFFETPDNDLPETSPLQYCLEQAESNSLRVHAWINCLNFGTDVSAEVREALEAKTLQCDSRGSSILKYAGYAHPDIENNAGVTVDTPGIWLDPASTESVTLIVELVDHLLATYPIFTGIHLDYIRYPYFVPVRPSSAVSWGMDFGYSEESRSRFEADSGIVAAFDWDRTRGFLLQDYESSLAWDNWRRENVNRILRDIKKILPVQKLLSVAAVAFADRAYLSAFQDWRYWMSERLVDAVCLMSYTGDDRLFRYLVTQAAPYQDSGVALLAGIGAYKVQNMAQLEGQIETAYHAGAAGTVLFSYRNLLLKSW